MLLSLNIDVLLLIVTLLDPTELGVLTYTCSYLHEVVREASGLRFFLPCPQYPYHRSSCMDGGPILRQIRDEMCHYPDCELPVSFLSTSTVLTAYRT